MSLQIYKKYLPWLSRQAKAKNYICGEKIPVLRVLLVVIVLLLFSSCYDKGDCLVVNSTLINVSLKKRTNSATDSVVGFASIVMVETSDTLVKNESVASMKLPVNPLMTEAAFIFNYLNSDKPDTLKFTYRNETVIPTNDCGAFIYQKDVKLKTTYDSTLIRVINNQLLSNVPINFEILY
jgi:hypothetical protein